MAQRRGVSHKKRASFGFSIDKLKKLLRIQHVGVHVVFVIFLCVSLLLIYRLYHIQVIYGDVHASQVERQYNNVYADDIFARGNIYFTYQDGTRLLVATNQDYYTVIINNRNIDDAEKVRAGLHTVMTFDDKHFDSIIAKTNDPYEILVKKINQDQAKAVRALRLPGVELHVNQERYYPAGDLASNIIGFVSFQDDQLRGTYGLEKYYDNILRRDGNVKSRSLFFSLFSNTKDIVTEDETSIEKNIAKEGSLISTIEPNVQEFLEQEVDSITDTYHSEYTAGIVMDPDTGQIYAMAVSDNFDINTDSKHYRNYLVEDRRELGSIMKPLTVSMALNDDTINTDFSYNDTGSMKLGKYTIWNFDKTGRGPFTTLQTILTQSLNTGIATIGLRLGFEKFSNYIYRLGLDSETGIDLPFESYGIVPNLNLRRDIELATASFGQGIAPTPIEMARSWAALASDGVLHTPQIVSMIEYGDLIPAKNVPLGTVQQVFTQATTNKITDILIRIVDDSQTFRSYSLPQHSIAIKTGTAQIPNPQGGYYTDQFLHSFVGYFPAKAKSGEQQFIVLLYTLKPQGAQYSSTTLKEGFFNTARYLINYYDIAPDRNVSLLDNIQ